MPVWSSTLGERPSVELVVTADHAVTVGTDLPMTARLLDGGDLAWTSPVLGTTVAGTPETVFAAGRSQVLAVEAGTGDLLWSASIPAAAAALVPAAGRLVVTTGREVLAFDGTTGAALWRAPLDGDAVLAAASVDLVAVALDDGSVIGLDLAGGARRWRTALDAMPVALAVGPDRVYAGLPHLALCGLARRDGHIDWCTTQLRAPVAGPPLVRGDTLVVAQRDGGLRTLDRGTGTMRHYTLLRGRPAAGALDLGQALVVPLVSDELIHVATGPLERIPSPEPNRRSPTRAAVSPDGQVVVTLAVRVAGEWVLTAYRAPTPPS